MQNEFEVVVVNQPTNKQKEIIKEQISEYLEDIYSFQQPKGEYKWLVF